MNSRLEALIKRGYPKEDVIRLSSFTESELEYACNMAFEHISRRCTPVDNPSAIFIGGQPGSGKTVLSMELKNKIGNAIEIGIDNYRMYHPHYLEIEKYIREFWKNKTETINDTKGNDIADFTHYFAGVMTDKLIEMASCKGYNLLLEWGMREPTAPLKCMGNLKRIGYNNTVIFVSTYKGISYEACNLRSDIMKNSNHIIRKVPKSFHDYSVSTLPSSVGTIYKEGYSNHIIDYMALISRDGKVVWDDKSKSNPKDIYEEYLNNPELSKDIKNDFTLSYKSNLKEMEGLNQQVVLVVPEILNMVKTK